MSISCTMSPMSSIGIWSVKIEWCPTHNPERGWHTAIENIAEAEMTICKRQMISGYEKPEVKWAEVMQLWAMQAKELI